MNKQRQTFLMTDGNYSGSGEQLKNGIASLPTAIITLSLAVYFRSALTPFDAAFGVLSPLYLILANKFRFDNKSAAIQAGLSFEMPMRGDEKEK
eukprot:10653055-Ditylum_brightwellii.AAC.1